MWSLKRNNSKSDGLDGKLITLRVLPFKFPERRRRYRFTRLETYFPHKSWDQFNGRSVLYPQYQPCSWKAALERERECPLLPFKWTLSPDKASSVITKTGAPKGPDRGTCTSVRRKNELSTSFEINSLIEFPPRCLRANIRITSVLTCEIIGNAFRGILTYFALNRIRSQSDILPPDGSLVFIIQREVRSERVASRKLFSIIIFPSIPNDRLRASFVSSSDEFVDAFELALTVTVVTAWCIWHRR